MLRQDLVQGDLGGHQPSSVLPYWTWTDPSHQTYQDGLQAVCRPEQEKACRWICSEQWEKRGRTEHTLASSACTLEGSLRPIRADPLQIVMSIPSSSKRKCQWSSDSKGRRSNEASSRSPPKTINLTSEGEGPSGVVKKFDFNYLFKFSFNVKIVCNTAIAVLHNSTAQMLRQSKGTSLDKLGDYKQSLIDQLVELHFMACHAGPWSAWSSSFGE